MLNTLREGLASEPDGNTLPQDILHRNNPRGNGFLKPGTESYPQDPEISKITLASGAVLNPEAGRLCVLGKVRGTTPQRRARVLALEAAEDASGRFLPSLLTGEL
jgi:hypothetical protein